MPLLTNPLGAATAPDVPRALVALDLPSATWADPTGEVWQLMDWSLPYWTVTGPKGLGAAPITITSDQVARGGSSVRHVQPQSRIITWPLYMEAANHTDFIALWRALAGAFASTRRRGPGQLTIRRPDGTARQIDAYYQDGMDNTPEYGIVQDVVALNLFCPSPFWRALEPLVASHTRHGPGVSYLSPYPTVSTSKTLGRALVDNVGSVEAWPMWTITGPADSVTAVNHTTGKAWTLDPIGFRGIALGPGEVVTIMTDPAAVVGPSYGGSTGWAGALNWPAAQLWELLEGNNDVEYVVTGSGVQTTIDITFYPRYETA